MTLLEEVHTRGYWSVVVRPQEFKADRVPKLSDVEVAVRESAVELRGWDFPHYDHREPSIRGGDWLAQECAWEHHRELWRAYKSGLFLQHSGLWNDWRDRSSFWPANKGWKAGQHLHVEDTIFRLSEIFEFAARFSRTTCGGEFMAIDIELHNLDGRTLRLGDHRAGFVQPRMCRVNEWKHSTRLAREFLLAQGRNLAIQPAIELFELFAWDVEEKTVRDIQGELRG